MSTLIVMRSTPYGNTNAKDALDIALILALLNNPLASYIKVRVYSNYYCIANIQHRLNI